MTTDSQNLQNRIFIINGAGGVGKDTFVTLTQIYFAQKDFEVLNISNTDLVKQAFRILGWDGTKNAKNRQALSDLKDFSTEYNNGPVEYVIDNAKKITDKNMVMFAHCREPLEIKELKEKLTTQGYEVETVVVLRNGIAQFKNHADSNTANFDYDYTINNNKSLEELQQSAEKFVTRLFHNEHYNNETAKFISNEEYYLLENPIFQGQTRLSKEGQHKMYWKNNGIFYYTINNL